MKISAGVNTITFTSMTSDGGPNFDMFTFGIDGVEIYDGTQKIPDSTDGLPTVPFKGIASFNPSTGVLFTPRAGFAEVYFYDMSGTMRMGVSESVNSGLTSLNLDSEMLPKGVYVLKVKVDGRLVQKSVYRRF